VESKISVATVIVNCPHGLKIPLCRSWVNAGGVVRRGGMAAELDVVDLSVEILPVKCKALKHFDTHNKENI